MAVYLYFYSCTSYLDHNQLYWNFDKAFDKYPYILLNLVLSCLAAVQAPIIMMSQNRQAARDRLEADNDYEVNLKAEIEVALLHEKIDYLITSQWQHMVQMQQMQIELLGKLQKQVNDLNNDQKNK
ncbi:DUF1003 domain-containing protein [Enterococcus rivorum]|uniref:DUF1003 domain-containing protein n=1 Tax=Enterococcus rivorum TaxID=762845 RepID=UPI00364309EB